MNRVYGLDEPFYAGTGSVLLAPSGEQDIEINLKK
jgi:hypothetical protein